MIGRSPTRRWIVLPVALFLAHAAPGPAAAQTGTGEDTGCELGVVTHIFIDNHSIFDTSDPDLDARFRWAYSLANKLHIRTREDVIARDLLFQVGDCYEPIVLEESARLLRGRGFLGRVDIYGVQQPEGGYHVVVDTEDEWSTQVDLKFDLAGRFEFEAFEVREKNLLGTGRTLAFFYRSIDASRSYGLRYETPQLFRSRWHMEFSAGRTRSGTLLHQQLRYPFLGESGRWAFRQWLTRRDRLFDYVLPRDHTCSAAHGTCRVLVPIHQNGVHVAGVRRFGERGNLTVFGLGVSYQDLSFQGTARDSTIMLVRGRDYEAREPAPAPLQAEAGSLTEPLRNVRGVVLLGKRNIRWERRTGLDAFRGDEDVRVGAEIEMAFARSIPGIERDNDLYGSMDLYAAAGPESLFFGTRVRADARRDYDTTPGQNELKDVFAEGEAFVYVQPPFLPRHTVVFRAAGAGGWHVETPFQLTLGGERSLRGWPEEELPGGRRAVFTVEDRWFIGWPLPGVADFGTTLFADVGRVWAGEAPFGDDSGWRATLGAGLRANFPARGRNTFRVDLAFPVGPDGSLGGFQLLVGVGEYVGITTRFSDPQFDRSRIPPITGNLLHFPN